MLYYSDLSLKFPFIVVENSVSFHTVFIKLETRIDKKHTFSHWLFMPMKKLTVISSSLEIPQLLQFLTRAYLQSRLSDEEKKGK